jgi:hypothetical protein
MVKKHESQKGFMKQRPKIDINPQKLVGKVGVDTRGLKEAGREYDRRQAEARTKAINILKAKDTYFKK